MKNIKYAIPNGFTLLNLLLGTVAIITVFRGQNEYNAAWFIFAAAFFDLLDGLAARLLNAKSEFGKNLDSLADMVSFGIAPTLILFQWIIIILTKLSAHSTFQLSNATFLQVILLLLSLLYASGGAIRLARFNSAGESSRDFKGLPIPAAAIIVATMWLLIDGSSDQFRGLLLNMYVVLSTIIILFLLMVSNVRMLSLKFTGVRFKDNRMQYIILLAGFILIALFLIPGILYTLIFYLLLSLVYSVISKNQSD